MRSDTAYSRHIDEGIRVDTLSRFLDSTKPTRYTEPLEPPLSYDVDHGFSQFRALLHAGTISLSEQSYQ